MESRHFIEKKLDQQVPWKSGVKSTALVKCERKKGGKFRGEILKKKHSMLVISCYWVWLMTLASYPNLVSAKFKVITHGGRLTTSPYVHGLAIRVLPKDFRRQIARRARKACPTGGKMSQRTQLSHIFLLLIKAILLCLCERGVGRKRWVFRPRWPPRNLMQGQIMTARIHKRVPVNHLACA